VLVLFPMSVYPTLYHRTPNSPLHWMVLDHIVMALQGGVDDMARVIAADFPSGRPVRVIGWPVQLLAVPWVPVFGRVGALNVALLVSLVLSGVLMVRVLARMDLKWEAQLIGGLAWVFNPLMVSFLSNGQYENHIGFALPLAILGLMRGDIRGEMMVGAGLLLAAFSSPYQVVPAAIVVTSILWMVPQRRLGTLVFILGCVFSCCYWYYTGPQPAPGGECGPTSGSMPLVLSELVGATGAIHAEMPFQESRLDSLLAAFSQPVQRVRELDLHNLNVAPGSGFLGLIPLILGVVGLWRLRASGWSKPLALGAVGCVAFAIGPELSWARGASVDLPLPADLFALFPGLSDMGTTLRFMSGAAFVLVMGLAFFVQGVQRSGVWALMIGLGVVGEWAFGTVSDVPMRARSYQLPAGFDALPEEGAVITVPLRERVSPEAHLWMGALIDRNVVGYCDRSVEEYAQDYRIIDYVQGGRPPGSAVIADDFARLHASGIGYVAFMVTEPGADLFDRSARSLEFVLGTPDAVGDGIIGYRTDRSAAQK
jgi:hypothetical protein